MPRLYLCMKTTYHVVLLSCNQLKLPANEETMPAISISIISLIFALFALFVSAEKFRLDLYNKRLDIYIRTVKFYQDFFSPNIDVDGKDFSETHRNFILAVRESQFLFDPKDGIYDLLEKLAKASFTIMANRDIPPGADPDTLIARHKASVEANNVWHFRLESLEGMMAPYLNYHYRTDPSFWVQRVKEAIGSARKWMLARRLK